MTSNSKNIIIAAIAMVGFLLFWDLFVVSRYTPKKPKESHSAETAATTITAKTSFVAAESRPQTSVLTTSIRKEVELKTDKVRIVFDTKGASVVSWHIYERDHWLEMIPGEKKSDLRTLEIFSDLNFSVIEHTDDQIQFSAVHPQGFEVRKTVELLGEPPFHKLTVSLKNLSTTAVDVDASLSWASGLARRVVAGPIDNKEESAVKAEMRVVAFSDRAMTYRPGFIFGRTKDVVIPSGVEWIGVDNHHFMGLIVSPQGQIEGASVHVKRSELPSFEVPVQKSLSVGESFSQTFLLYVGPKSYTELETYPHHIAHAVDFGMFGVIAKALLKALHTLYSYTGNYGWAIIILTICVQLLLFPLTRKSLKYSLRMKELQPQIKVLQEQFKSDPKRLQIETYNLYKKNGLKLMGMEGCLPMVLQMPVFFAFYATMQAAYELRGAPWIFWIHDLGTKDPYYLLPVLMGVGMFVQQKLSAVAADPAQARIMMLMPVMFVFMFAHLPSGLVLYWFTNSLMSILTQQLFMLTSKPQNSLNPPS